MRPMDDETWLVAQFEENRTHLKAVARRMLGAGPDADDAVQEAWIRLSRAGAEGVENLRGWLTTVVARVCLDMLRSRTSRREEPLEVDQTGLVASDYRFDPEQQALIADSVGPALLVVLETLTPTERIAFVLHDMFAVSFDEIAPIVGRSAAATRQLASRARRRVQGMEAAPDVDLARQRAVVDAFLAASRNGDFEALLAVLDPDVVLRADATTVQAGAEREVRGALAVAGTFSGRARFAQTAIVDGAVGAVWAPGGTPRVIFGLTIADGRIVEINLISEPESLGRISLAILED
jgi:RNA polymerase sigma factor (sigma-70 family)